MYNGQQFGDSGDGQYGSLLKQFTGADLENEPGYKFGLEQGQLGIDRKAAAGGNYFSGAALKAAARYGQDYAGTKYDAAYNRDAADKTRAYNFLSGGVTTGQNSAALTGTTGMQAASQVANNTTSLGNAQGAAQIAGANAIGSGINSAINGYQQNKLIQAILNRNTGFGTGSQYGNQDYGQYF